MSTRSRQSRRRPAQASSHKDYYAILGVERRAEMETIKRAFRLLAKQHHPDRNAGRPSPLYELINEAYQVLSDPKKRADYDYLDLFNHREGDWREPGASPSQMAAMQGFFGGQWNETRVAAGEETRGPVYDKADVEAPNLWGIRTLHALLVSLALTMLVGGVWLLRRPAEAAPPQTPSALDVAAGQTEKP